jgi:DnaJ-class molecular chaperone
MTDHDHVLSYLAPFVQPRQSTPQIVRTRCAWCGGSGMRERETGALRTLDSCTACAGTGNITVESPR